MQDMSSRHSAEKVALKALRKRKKGLELEDSAQPEKTWFVLAEKTWFVLAKEEVGDSL